MTFKLRSALRYTTLSVCIVHELCPVALHSIGVSRLPPRCASSPQGTTRYVATLAHAVDNTDRDGGNGGSEAASQESRLEVTTSASLDNSGCSLEADPCRQAPQREGPWESMGGPS